MADDAQDAGRSSGIIWKLALIAVILLIPVGLALLTFRLVLAPALGESGAMSTQSEAPANPDAIPATAVTVPMHEEPQFKNVIMEDPNFPASMLIYEVSLECSNPETAAIVERHKARFNAMIDELHSYRTRSELEDPQVKQSIQQQILDRANEILRRAQSNPNPDNRIIAVFHNQFAIRD